LFRKSGEKEAVEKSKIPCLDKKKKEKRSVKAKKYRKHSKKK